MSSITSGDFTFFKKMLNEDRGIHEKMYLNRINPATILAYYEGIRTPAALKDSHSAEVSRAMGTHAHGQHGNELELDRIALNKIFPATNTVATTLYPSNPGFTAGARREQDETVAKVAQAAMNYYFEEMNALDANQRAIINAWLFGFGTIKQGWRTVFKRKSSVNLVEKEASNKLPSLAEKLGITSQKAGDLNVEVEDDDEFIEMEEPFIYSVPNEDMILDGTRPFGKGKRITQHFKRSLWDIRKAGIYDITDDFISKFSKKKDQREIMLDLWEMWIEMPDGWHILAMVDGPVGSWKQPLRWDRSPYMAEGHAFSLLRLNLEPEMTYPISHMAAAQRLHRQSDYILTQQLKHIRKHRSMDLFYEKALDTNAKNAIKENVIGGYGFSSKPLAEGVHQHIGGSTIPPDLFNMQELIDNNIREILSITGPRVAAAKGPGKGPTATSDRIAELGNQLRTQTMTDQVNLFLKSQGKKLLQDLKQFATSPMLFKVTGLSMTDPNTGQDITEQWVEFATEENPATLKDAIQADLDVSVDAVNLARRTEGLVQLEMERILALISQPLVFEKLQAEGTDFSMTEFIKDMIETLQTMKNADKYFTKKDQQQPQEEQQAEPVEIGENIIKTTQADEAGNKVENTQKEKVFA